MTMNEHLPLKPTKREVLRYQTGANTHFRWPKSIYSKDSRTPNQSVIAALIESGLGYIRERWDPRSEAQTNAFIELANAGVELYLTLADMDSKPEQIARDMETLSLAPFAQMVRAVTGPNECNGHQSGTWPERAVSLQKMIFQAAYDTDGKPRYATLSSVDVVGPSLMHNVPHISADVQKLAEARIGDQTGLAAWITCGDLHAYPGNAGPVTYPKFLDEIAPLYGAFNLYMSETGWTRADTTDADKARMSVEAFLRGFLLCSDGTYQRGYGDEEGPGDMLGVSMYEFADESPTDPNVSKHEGLFGFVSGTADHLERTDAYQAVQRLLVAPDGVQEEDITVGVSGPGGVESDALAVLLSNGDDNFVIHVMKQEQDTISLALPGHLALQGAGDPSRVGSHGRKHYDDLPLEDALDTFEVTAA